MGMCAPCVHIYTTNYTHTEESGAPSVIFNQEYDPSTHLGFLSWWAEACTQQHICLWRTKTLTHTYICKPR